MTAVSADVGFVSDADIDTLGNGIRTFDAEVQAAGVAERAKEASGSKQPITDFYLQEVFPLTRDWNAWVKDNTGTLSRIFGDAAYAGFRERYMAIRAKWTTILRQTTTAPPVTSQDADVTPDIANAVKSGWSDALLLLGCLGGLYILANRRKG